MAEVLWEPVNVVIEVVANNYILPFHWTHLCSNRESVGEQWSEFPEVFALLMRLTHTDIISNLPKEGGVVKGGILRISI